MQKFLWFVFLRVRRCSTYFIVLHLIIKMSPQNVCTNLREAHVTPLATFHPISFLFWCGVIFKPTQNTVLLQFHQEFLGIKEFHDWMSMSFYLGNSLFMHIWITASNMVFITLMLIFCSFTPSVLIFKLLKERSHFSVTPSNTSDCQEQWLRFLFVSYCC